MKIPETYKDLNINIFSTLFSSSIKDLLTDILKNSTLADIEFISMVKTKKLSTFIKILIEVYGVFVNDVFDGLSETGLNAISDSIISQFEYKWKKIYDINKKEYDALKPFNITLNEKANDKLSTQKDRTTYTDNDGTYGFNSTLPSPADKTDGESNREYERTIDNSRDYTRIGNIGNTSFQDLIEQERKIADYKFKQIILQDISSIICRGIWT